MSNSSSIVRESRWIKQLRSEIERRDAETSGDIWASVTVRLELGSARRLLYILDLVRELEEPCPCPANEGRNLNEIAGEEAYLLATGAIEG
jgi:hypothetical protein